MSTATADGTDAGVGLSAVGQTTRVTIVSGFLGSGKTTLILSLMRQLQQQQAPPHSNGTTAADGSSTASFPYRVCWLKNEVGEVAVDSRLAGERNLTGVMELTDGCICCIRVGQLEDALTELITRFAPHRILLETSGSSHPATIVRECQRARDDGRLPTVLVDGVVCVIDAVNFRGYVDKSRTAKIQAQYTNLILINKHELLREANGGSAQKAEAALDRVLDDLYELNPATPKIKTHRGEIDYQLIFGLDKNLLKQQLENPSTATSVVASHAAADAEVRVIDLTLPATHPIAWSQWRALLASLPNDVIYRVKGVIHLTVPKHEQLSAPIASSELTTANGAPAPSGAVEMPPLEDAATFPHLLNFAFGRFDLVPLSSSSMPSFQQQRVSFMGDRTLPSYVGHIRSALDLASDGFVESIRVLASSVGSENVSASY